MSRAKPAKTSNGSATKRPPRRKKTAPEIREKTRKLILKAFQKTYEAHHGKSS
ncbi:MAG: hypothetical protein AB1631_32885 [Acidobacteriota bacterium]